MPSTIITRKSDIWEAVSLTKSSDLPSSSPMLLMLRTDLSDAGSETTNLLVSHELYTAMNLGVDAIFF